MGRDVPAEAAKRSALRAGSTSPTSAMLSGGSGVLPHGPMDLASYEKQIQVRYGLLVPRDLDLSNQQTSQTIAPMHSLGNLSWYA